MRIASKYNAQYQKMIRGLLDDYVSKHELGLTTYILCIVKFLKWGEIRTDVRNPKYPKGN